MELVKNVVRGGGKAYVLVNIYGEGILPFTIQDLSTTLSNRR